MFVYTLFGELVFVCVPSRCTTDFVCVQAVRVEVQIATCLCVCLCVCVSA